MIWAIVGVVLAILVIFVAGVHYKWSLIVKKTDDPMCED